MKRVWRLFRGFGFVGCLALIASACGGDSDDGKKSSAPSNDPKELCGQLATKLCDRAVNECFSDVDRPSIIPDDAGKCRDQLILVAQCTSATDTQVCAGTQPINVAQAQSCLSELTRASCQQFRSGQPTMFAPSCGPCVPDALRL